MVFEQPFFDNFYDNFISHTHMIILISFSITLIFMPLPKLLCVQQVVTRNGCSNIIAKQININT